MTYKTDRSPYTPPGHSHTPLRLSLQERPLHPAPKFAFRCAGFFPFFPIGFLHED